MSHFTVLVIGENPESQLAPYNEQLEVPRYVKYTKGQLIEKKRREIDEYKTGLYADYLANPEKYTAECKNERHIKYISKEFPEKLNWSDDKIYEDSIKYFEPEEIGVDGEIYSEYNPKSKWDWYQLGGRWTGYFKVKQGATLTRTGTPGMMTDRASDGTADQLLKRDIDFSAKAYTPYAIVMNGEWFEKGEMGWFGMSYNEKSKQEWDEKVKEIINSVPDDTLFSLYDCHI